MLRYALDDLHVSGGIAAEALRSFAHIGNEYVRCVLATARILGADWDCYGLEGVTGMHPYALDMLWRDTLSQGAPGATSVSFAEGDYSGTCGGAKATLAASSLLFSYPTTGKQYLTTLTSVFEQKMRDHQDC